MKKIYNVAVICVLFSLSFIAQCRAFDTDPIGLRLEGVRMSDLERLASAYMAPAHAVLDAIAVHRAGSRPSSMAWEGEQAIGGGLIYGSEIEKLGLQFTYFYFMTAAIALGGDLSFFFPDKIEFFDSRFTQTLFTLNVMAHYIVVSTLILRAYALAGLNYAVFRFKNESGGMKITSSDSELGLNLGGGIEYALASGFLYLELKYIISKFDQLVLAIGYRHLLGR